MKKLQLFIFLACSYSLAINAAQNSSLIEMHQQMVKIPAGSFQMGSTVYSDEQPMHRVTIASFYMQAHEVTWAQYQPCIDAGVCVNNDSAGGDKGWGKGNRPVIEVSWKDVQLYINWLKDQGVGTFRLPSEAEWEYAARAGSTTKYSWGKSIGNDRANCHSCGSQWDDTKTAPVKSFSPNAFGLYDMHGNVWEWVQDCWKNNYSGAPINGSASKGGDCSQRVLRGGSWYDLSSTLSSANRFVSTSSTRNYIVGFRLVEER